MSKINRRSFLGLLKLLPFVPLVAKLPAPPVVEQATETASAEGGFLVPAEFTAQLRQMLSTAKPVAVVLPQVRYTWQVSQELIDDGAVFPKYVEQEFQRQLQDAMQPTELIRP